MDKSSGKSNWSQEQKLDVVGNIFTIISCICLMIWISGQILSFVAGGIHQIFITIVYLVLDIFCLAYVVTIGKKLLSEISKWNHHA